MEKKRSDLIVAFGFAGENLANNAVADRASELAEFYEDDIVFTEESIHARLGDLPTGILFARAEDKPLSTLRVIKVMKGSEYIRKNDCTHVFLIAPPHREWRCARDLRKMGFEVLTDVYFRKHNPRWWADKYPMPRALWWTRELILRVLPWPIYSRITG